MPHLNSVIRNLFYLLPFLKGKIMMSRIWTITPFFSTEILHLILLSADCGPGVCYCFPVFCSVSHKHFFSLSKSRNRLKTPMNPNQNLAPIISDSVPTFFSSLAFTLTRPPMETPRLKCGHSHVCVYVCASTSLALPHSYDL